MRWLAASLLILILTFAWTKAVHGRQVSPKGPDSDETAQIRKGLLLFLNDLLSYILGEKTNDSNQHSPKGSDLSIMTWNILGQIFVDVDSLNATGVIDTNLLDKDIRLGLTIRRILESKADIVALQEVQIDTCDVIKESVSNVYKANPFAPHGPKFRGIFQLEAMENGQATLFNKQKYISLSSEVFYTSDDQNSAHISIFRRIRRGDPDTAYGPPVLVANCHLRSGFETSDILLRVSQGNAIISRLSNITEELRERYPTFEPIVIMTGDFNSFTGAPGLENIKSRGYTDVKELSANTLDTIFFTSNITVPFVPPFDGLSIDKILVSTSDVDSGRIVTKSTSVPDVREDPYLEEEPYIRQVMGIVVEDLTQGKIDQAEASRRLEVLQDSLTDGKEYDSATSRVLRLGSDHAPLSALLKIIY